MGRLRHVRLWDSLFIVGTIVLLVVSGITPSRLWSRLDANLGHLALLWAIAPVVGPTHQIPAGPLSGLQRSSDYFAAALKADPRNTSASVGLTVAATLSGDYRRAQEIAADPQSESGRSYLTTWFIDRSAALLEQSMPEQSEQVLSIARHLLPSAHDARYGLRYIRIGQAFQDRGRIADAQRVFTAGLTLDDNDGSLDDRAILNYYLGVITFTQGTIQASSGYLSEAVAIDPFNQIGGRWWIWDSQMKLAQIASKQGFPARAAEYYRAAVAAAMDDAQFQTAQRDLQKINNTRDR